MAPSNRKYPKVGGILLAILLAGTIALVWTFVNSIRDPYGPRRCECALLQEWAASLPLTTEGDHFQVHEISTSEDHTGFAIRGSGLEGIVVDRDALLGALTAAGINHQVLDQADRWIVTVYPGTNRLEAEWELEVTVTETTLGMLINVAVDGSAWNLETIDDLYDFYRDNPEAASNAQEERQSQAIEVLQPLQQALEAIVADS